MSRAAVLGLKQASNDSFAVLHDMCFLQDKIVLSDKGKPGAIRGRRDTGPLVADGWFAEEGYLIAGIFLANGAHIRYRIGRFCLFRVVCGGGRRKYFFPLLMFYACNCDVILYSH